MYLIPEDEMGPEQMSSFRAALSNKLITRALQLAIAHDRNSLHLRELFPFDLNLSDWQVRNLNRQYETGWYVCGIYKVLQLNANPKAKVLDVFIGHSRVAMMNLEVLYGSVPTLAQLAQVFTDPELVEVMDRLTGDKTTKNISLGAKMEGYLSESVVFDPDTHGTLRCDATGDYILLGGLVVELKGRTVV